MISINEVYIWYNQQYILENINLNLKANQIYALVGKNGSGKTTLINTICGVLSTFKGSIKIRNVSFSSKDSNQQFQKSKKERYCVVDTPERVEYMNCNQYINFILDVYNTEKDNGLLKYYIERYQFKQHQSKMIGELSLGNLKKLNIICAFLVDVKILIFDEPFNGLDIQSIERFIEDIKEMKDEGYLIILSTHLLDIIERITDNVILVNNSKVSHLILKSAHQIREVLDVDESS